MRKNGASTDRDGADGHHDRIGNLAQQTDAAGEQPAYNAQQAAGQYSDEHIHRRIGQAAREAGVEAVE